MKTAIVTVAVWATLLAAPVFWAGAAAASPCGATGVFYAPMSNPHVINVGPMCEYRTVGVDTFTAPPYQKPIIQFDVIGAGIRGPQMQRTGRPGLATGKVAVTAFDQVFDIRVGGMPTGSPPILGQLAGSCDVGGFNGGGNSGDRFAACGGAGASDVRPSGGGLTDRLLVGGGGGGSTIDLLGGRKLGGDGGGESGGDGVAAECTVCIKGDPGGGGSQFGGGASPGNASSAGFGFGGAGGLGTVLDGGAGGGGGYYGGGGSGTSGNTAGAGGGSGYVDRSLDMDGNERVMYGGLFTGVSLYDDGNDDGQVDVMWSETPLTANVIMTADHASPVGAGTLVRLTATVTISNGARPVGVVILTDYSQGNGAANPSAPGNCPCSAIGQGYLDPDGTFSVTVNASSIPHGPYHDIVAKFVDSYAFIPNTSSSGLELDVAAAAQTITFTSTVPTNTSAFGPPYTVSATASSGLPVTFSIAVDSASATVCTIAGSVVSFVAPGICNILANQAGNASFSPAPQMLQSVTVTAPAGTQTIHFTSTAPANAQADDTYTVTATGGGSGNPVVFSASAASHGTCTVSPTGHVILAEAGTCQILADQAGGNGFGAAPQTEQDVTIGGEAQSVIFETTPPATPHVSDTYVVSAHATSKAAPALTLDASSSGCTLTGLSVHNSLGGFTTSGTVTFTGYGTCVVDGNQAGFEGFWLPAPQVQQVITIAAPTATATATFPTATATATIPFTTPTSSPASTPTFTSTALPTNTATTTPAESATPRMSPTPSATSTSTPPATATATPTPANACAVAPRAACQQARRASSIDLNAAAHTMRERWRGATSMALSDFGDPVSGATGYHLCLYDTSAGPPTLAFSATVPPGGTCGTRPCWTQRRNRLLYTNTAGTPDGVRHMTLAASGRANASIVLSGRGPHLSMPVSADGVFLLRAFPEVIMQVQRSDAPDCWEAVFQRPWARDTRWVFTDLIR